MDNGRQAVVAIILVHVQESYIGLYIPIMAQFMESERGNILIVLDKFKFFKVNRPLASGLIKWRCIMKTCNAFLKTYDQTTNIAEQNDVHNHSANSDQMIQRQIVSVLAKRKAVEDKNEKPSKIVCTAIESIPESEALQVSDLHNIKRNIYNAKRKKFPPLPKSG
eukprot:XP_016659839.1 PREDICTED: uncharacterized protein LOC107883734 [Acyrthosiphon pisum]